MTPQLRMAALVRCLKGCNPQWQRPGPAIHQSSKVCLGCKEIKPAAAFYTINKGDGGRFLSSRCRPCAFLQTQQRRAREKA